MSTRRLAAAAVAATFLLAACSWGEEESGGSSGTDVESGAAEGGTDVGTEGSGSGTDVSVEPAEDGTSVTVVADGLGETQLYDGAVIGETDVEVRVAELLGSLETRETEGSETVVVLPENVLFAFDEAELQPASTAVLDRVVELIGLSDDSEVLVVGHTDSQGSDDYNQDLSERRAQAVVSYLVEQGVDDGRLVAEGRGETEPTADNDTDEGRAQNRRVEVLIDGLPGQD